MLSFIALAMIGIAIYVCRGAAKLNPVYAMLTAMAAGASWLAAFLDLSANRPISFLIWSLYAFINTVTIVRWLAAHAHNFTEI